MRKDKGEKAKRSARLPEPLHYPDQYKNKTNNYYRQNSTTLIWKKKKIWRGIDERQGHYECNADTRVGG